VRLVCEDETISVPIFDERPLEERETDIPPEVDSDLVQAMRDELLFEQYGGRVASDDDTDIDSETSTDAGDDQIDPAIQNLELGQADPEDEVPQDDIGHVVSYAIPAFTLARRHLAVVDNWTAQVACAEKRATTAFEREVLRRDCELLIDAFARQAVRDDKKGPAWSIGARLAAEELTLRLKHLPEA
jgi:hypothetical protein